MSIPIGAAVRYQGTLGRVVPKTPSRRLSWNRGALAVVLDGRSEIDLIETGLLQYVAQRYETAKLWEKSDGDSSVQSRISGDIPADIRGSA